MKRRIKEDSLNNYLEVNTSNLAPTRTGNSLLCFKNEKAFGGKVARVSQNHQFSNATPQFNCITPGRTTRVNSSFRTISGTSADGTENSFVDQGFEPAILNQATFFPTPRLVASKINENARLATLPKTKQVEKRSINESVPCSRAYVSCIRPAEANFRTLSISWDHKVDVNIHSLI